ncbi:Glycosyl transferase, family 17 [Dillenia turbinata]|uniref:Glycosyl transferase, family 17 n=1 Tax=Dillenia turbinata TaxID=194707 RepID=A0AAN8ZPB3_9MAGN
MLVLLVHSLNFVESNATFTGIPKPSIFTSNRDCFKFAEGRIENRVLPIPGSRLKSLKNSFHLEAEHRISMNGLPCRAGIGALMEMGLGEEGDVLSIEKISK